MLHENRTCSISMQQVACNIVACNTRHTRCNFVTSCMVGLTLFHLLKCRLFDRFSTKKHVINIKIFVYASNLDHFLSKYSQPNIIDKHK